MTATSGTTLSYQWLKNGSSISGASLSSYTIASVQASDQGTYTVQVSNAGGTATSSGATLTVLLPPTITTQPRSQSVAQNMNVSFSVVASGTAPLSYQWSFNGTALSGATSSSYTIATVQATNAGTYTVKVSNSGGATTSSPAILEVHPPVLLVDVQFLGTSGTTWPSGSGSPQTGAAVLGASGDTWNQEGLTYYVYPGTSTDIYASNLVNSANAASGITLTVGSSPNSVFGGQQANATATDPATTNLMSSAIEQFALTANVDVWTITVGGLSAYAGEQFNLVVYAGAPSARTQTISVSGGASGGNTSSALTTSSASRMLSAGAGVAYQVFTNGTLNGSNLVFTVNGGTAAVDTYAAFLNGFQLQIFNYPLITTQPAAQTNVAGSTVRFSVGASGGLLNYQWQTNGGSGYVNVGNSGIFSGANSNILTIADAPGYSALSYQVIVTNNVGSVTSAPATLYLTPQISTQPASQTTITGGNASFTVVADGSVPLRYQWNFNGTALSGATSSSYTIATVQATNAGTYSAQVSNAGGTVTSSAATLAVLLPPTVTTQPQSQTATQGLKAAFSVVASGATPLGYQWSLNGVALSSDTNATLTLTNVQTNAAGSYTVVVTNSLGSATSAVATLSILVPVGITTQPQSQGVAKGQNASFSIVAGGTSPLTYQWYFNSSAVGGGGQSSTLALNNVDPSKAGNYTVVVANPVGSVTSVVATLTVYVLPGIQTQPQNQTVLQGTNVSFSVVTNADGTPPFSYQWNVNGSNTIDGPYISGSTNATLTLSNVQSAQAGNVFVVITNYAGAVTSSIVTLTVNVPATITSQPQPQAVIQGQNASFSVLASGTAPLKYQWFLNGSSLSGGTSQNATLALSSVGTNNAGNYTVVVNNNWGSATSAVATLTVYVPAAITTQPQSQTATQGLNAAFSVVAGGTAPLACQWSFNGAPLAGATNATLALASVQTNAAGSYTVVVTNSWGSVTSVVATLTVLVPAGITTQPQSQAVVQHQNASFSVVASGSTPFTYQWYFNGSAVGGGGQSATLALNNVDTSKAGNYTVVVANPAGSVTSAVATLTVYVPPGIQTQPGNLTVTQGQSASFSVVANGSTPFSYQWNLNGSALSGATSSALVLPSAQATDAGSYTVAVTNPGGSVTSQVATLTVNVPAGITTQPQSQWVTPGQNTSFSVVAGGTAPLKYQWYLNGSSLPGATSQSSTLVLGSVATNNTGSYTVVVNNNWGSATSAVATLAFVVPPAIITQPQSLAVSAGQNATFSVVAASNSPPSYQWNFNGAPLSSATNSALTLANVHPANAGSYTVVLTNSLGSITSALATLTVIPPTPPSFGAAGMTPNGFGFQLSVPMGSTYVILASTNLQDWTPIATNVALTATVILADPAATNSSRRFYRVMLQ